MIVIGLTGSIGMGKSTVGKMFAEEGAPLFDSDAAVHALYAEGGAAVAPVEAAFPGVAGDSGIDRAVLSARVVGDADAIKRLASHAPNCVVVDPPRTGLERDVADGISKLGADRIVYLSCDPATLARDLARMMDRGYRLASLEGFDLFPQTPHVEALAVLVRAGG